MPRLVIVMLAFVAGWVDAASFVGLDHVMAAHITGNLVILAGAIATSFHDTDLLKIAILLLIAAAGLLALLVVIQLVPYGRDHANPPVTRPASKNTAAMDTAAAPVATKCRSIRNGCLRTFRDIRCHSIATCLQ